METTVLTTTFILIGLGVLVKRFPGLIAGYNLMSGDEKKNVDVKGLSTFICYSLVGMGAIPLLVYYICLGLGHADWASYCLFLPILYIPYLIFRANRFDHNPPRKSTRYVAIISAVILVVIGTLIFYSTIPTTLKVNEDKLVFTGMYGITKTLEDIVGVRLSDTLPDITLRLNGVSLGGINKGWFKMRAGGTCLLFLSSHSKPYIIFTEKSGKEIIFNSKTEELTMEAFRELQSLWH